MYTKLLATIEELDIKSIPNERQLILSTLIDFIQDKVNINQEIRLNFICTHNSRRSHLSQIWAQTMASYYHLNNVACYSGGTEATALYPAVTETLKQTGFQIQELSIGENPVYAIKHSENEQPIVGFSKRYNDAFNPKNQFAAIMTCSQADEGCPIVLGAEKRIPITYDDPKAFDNSTEKMEKYMERSLQIATELKYVFSQIRVNS